MQNVIVLLTGKYFKKPRYYGTIGRYLLGRYLLVLDELNEYIPKSNPMENVNRRMKTLTFDY